MAHINAGLLILLHVSMVFGTNLSPASVRVYEHRSQLGFLEARIETSDDTYSLSLKKIIEPSMDVHEIVIDEDGSLTILNRTTEDITYYEDEETEAIFYLNSKNKLEGVLSNGKFLKYHEEKHFITNAQEKSNHAEKCGTEGKKLDFNEELNEAGKYDENLERATTFYVEMGVLVDSALANSIGSNSDIVRYMGIFWKTVDKRYRSISGMTVRVVLPKLYVSRTTTVDNLFLHSIGGNNIDKDLTLDKLAQFANGFSTSSFDVLQLQTGRDLAKEENGRIETGYSGIAYVGTACYRSGGYAYNVGIAEDNAFWSGVRTSAHEVAHNLGSSHDGSGTSSSCSWQWGYIMSYLRINYRTTRFSSCTSNAIASLYSRSYASCLRTISNSNFFSYQYDYPGAQYSLQDQCRVRTGYSQATYDNTVSSSTHCYRLHCRYVIGSSIYSFRDIYPALEGTPCPSGGFCSAGLCQSSPN